MPRKQHTFHFIYKTTCLITDNFYIGMHSTSNMEDGYMGSGKRIRYSLNKHGVENHRIEHLQFFSTREELKKREAELVNESLLQDPLCMNLKYGGEGGWDVCNKSDAHKSAVIENAKKALEKRKWLFKNDDQWLERFKEKQKLNMLKQYATGIRKPKNFCDWTGKHHTSETKQKIGQKNALHQQGSGNSQFGTCWIYSLIEKRSLQIKKDQLDFYLNQGWFKGRKIKFK